MKAAINATTWLSHAMRSALACVAAFLQAASSGRGSEGLGGGVPRSLDAEGARPFATSLYTAVHKLSTSVVAGVEFGGSAFGTRGFG